MSRSLSSSNSFETIDFSRLVDESTRLLFTLLSKRQEEDSKSVINYTINELESYKKAYLKTKLSLVVVGSTCSGKTTLINGLLNAIIKGEGDADFTVNEKKELIGTIAGNDCNEKENDEESDIEWVDYLPSNSQENTITYTFINSVPKEKGFSQNKINLRVDNGDIQVMEKIEQLSEYLQKTFESDRSKYLEIKQKNRADIHLPKINLYLPNFQREIQIIDTPGISTLSFLKELKEIVEEGVCVFLYVKNLDAVEINHANILSFFEVTQNLYGKGNYQYWMVFTKEDVFSDNFAPKKWDGKKEKEKKTKEKNENFIRFLQNTEDEINQYNIKLNKIFNISTKIAFMEEHPQRQDVRKKLMGLIGSIWNFRRNDGDFFIKFTYLERMRILMDNLNKKLNNFNQIEQNTVDAVKGRAENEIDVFRNTIYQLLESKMMENATNFAFINEIQYKSCENTIKKANGKIKKETFLIKEKYRKRILELTWQELMHHIIQKKLIEIFKERFHSFSNFLTKKIPKEKLHVILGLDSEILEKEETNLTKLIFEGMDSKLDECNYKIKDVNLLDLASNVFNPGYREVYISYMIVKSLNLDNYVDIFPHQIENEDFVNIVLREIAKNKENISFSSEKQFRSFIFEAIVKKIEEAKVMNEELGQIDLMTRRFRTSEFLSRRRGDVTCNTIYEKMEENEFFDVQLKELFQKYRKGMKIRINN